MQKDYKKVFGKNATCNYIVDHLIHSVSADEIQKNLDMIYSVEKFS